MHNTALHIFSKRGYCLIIALFLKIIIGLHSELIAQSIPPERLTDWSSAGLHTPDIPIVQSINFEQVGGIGDGLTANDLAFQNLLNNLPEGLLEIYFPEGDYLFNQPLLLSGNILLKGSDDQQSRLVFDLIQADHLIKAEGTTDTLHKPLLADATRFQQNLTVADATSFAIGDFILLQEIDTALVTSDWATYSSGQLLRIAGIDGNIIQLTQPLRRDFTVARQAEIRRYHPVENIGIENLVVERLDSTGTQTSNFFFRYAHNCWLRCVESRRSNFAHVDLRYSSNIAITGSYFQDAFHFGNGGKAYGVMMQFASGENLVYDCSFSRLRHAMILQAGANGNVFAYNYSTEPFWTEVNLPPSSAGDIVLHGNYPYCNLFEGNICQNIVIDDSHGINGSLNTFFRNRAEHYGIFMSPILPSDNQNFIANEISNNDSLGYYLIFGEDQYEQANNHQGTINPASSTIPEESSLFLDTIPTSFNNNNWPPVGFPNNLNTFSIPAKERFENHSSVLCALAPQTDLVQDFTSSATLLLFPNPADEELRITFTHFAKAEEISIYAMSGALVRQETFSETLKIAHLTPGVYLLIVSLINGEKAYGKFVKQ